MDFMSTPQSLDLAITGRCNLRCLYCSHFSSAGDAGPDLPAEEWSRFFGELNRCAVMFVNLGGGEPFLRADLGDLIQSVVDNRMRYTILTNGTLVTREMAAYIAGTKRCDCVQVSIDGATPEAHDFCRGRGNFEKAVEGARYLIESGIRTTVRVTIHRNNVRDLDAIARFLLEEMGLASFSTNSASHMGLCRRNADIVRLRPAERVLAMESLLQLEKKYPGRIASLAGPLVEARHWTMVADAVHQGKALPGNFGFLSACNGPRRKLAVRPDGVMVPCGQMGHVELGRINRDSLLDVWRNHPELARLRGRHAIPLERFEFCRGCEYPAYCTGGCPATAYTYFGRDEHPSPEACFRQFLAEGGSLPGRPGAGSAGNRSANTYG